MVLDLGFSNEWTPPLYFLQPFYYSFQENENPSELLQT